MKVVDEITKPTSIVINDDCMEVMKSYPNNAFDLAIIDPPYGGGMNWRKDRKAKFYNHKNSFNDSPPQKEYFDELFRISKHQIIFGCNYYWNYLSPSNNLIFWDKGKGAIKQFGSAGELAWTSITKYPLTKVELNWNGFIRCEPISRIHPHQKPIKLYEWILERYANPGYRIIDTHLGSGSSRIAAYKAGFDFTGIERDKGYFDAQQERFEKWLKRENMQLIIK